jgi:hypothetical protein
MPDPTFTQADLDNLQAKADQTLADTQAALAAARAEVAAAQSAARHAEFTGLVSAAIDAGVPPALLTGAAEFGAALAGLADFQFSAAGETPAPQAPDAWFRAHLAGLADAVALVPMGVRRTPAGDAPGDFSARVKQYMADHPDADAATAAAAVRQTD